jgi:hypothetical protein
LKLTLRVYNPGELRVPARHPGGGEWTRGGDATDAEPQSLIQPVSDTDPDQPKPDPGGTGASVRLVDVYSNRALGAYIGRRCFGLPNGARIKISMGD